MKVERYKQIIAICESNAEDFQDKMNDALAGISDPEVVFDSNRSFTAYITYRVRKNVPEDVLELLEMINGEPHYCEECPHFEREKDKRKKWTLCRLKREQTRPDSRACEHYYLWRMKQIEQAALQYKEKPFMIE